MKKLILLLFILIIPIVYGSVEVNPTVIDLTWFKGDAQPTAILTFNNTDNFSRTITFTLSGDIINYLSTPSALTLGALSSQDLTLNFNIDNSTDVNTYIGYLNFGYGSVPIILRVKSSSSSSSSVKCFIDVVPDSYSVNIKKDTPAFSQKFTVSISKDCDEAVNVKTPLITGTTLTSAGQQPIALTGGSNLGWIDPQDEGDFSIQFDVSELTTGTYTPKITVYGYYKGERISTDVDIIVTVSETASPLTTEEDFTPPEYSIPDSVEVGKTFEIVARDLNPNLEPYIFPNDDLYGQSVEVKDNDWIYKAYFNKTGKHEIKIATYYKGAQIGSIFVKKITVTGAGMVASSDNMTFDFFPKISDLKDGDELNILVRDSVSNNLIPDATIYVNGKLLTGNTVTVHSDKSYYITASHPNYNTLDYNFTIAKKRINIYIVPENPTVGDLVSIITKDSVTNQDINATVLLDNQLIENTTFYVQAAGKHLIEASARGYEVSNLTFNVIEEVRIISAPVDKNGQISIKKGKNNTLVLNRNTTWTVFYQKSPEVVPEKIAEGTGNTVSFIPKKAGFYTIIADKARIYQQQIKGMTLSIPLWVWFSMAGLILLMLLLGMLKGKKRSGYGFSTSESSVVQPVK